MVTWSGNQDGQGPGVMVPKDNKTLTIISSKDNTRDTVASGSDPSCSPKWFPTNWLMSNHLKVCYCLEVQVVLTEEGKSIPPPPHTWQTPVVEDILHEGKSSLTEAVITSPEWAMLFYGKWTLGEGLSPGEARGAVFILSGMHNWIGKTAQVNIHAVSLREGRWVITKDITEWHTEARGPGHPRPNNQHIHYLGSGSM